MLFLAGAGHGSCGKVKRTRRYPPMGRRVYSNINIQRHYAHGNAAK